MKIWFITGANRGIGRAIGEYVLEKGDSAVLTARRPAAIAEMEALEQKYPGRVLRTLLDMDQADQMSAAVEGAIQKFGRIDVLINNAGYGLQGFIEEVGLKQCREQMETNFFGLLALTQAVIPGMREQGSGYIVNISSIAGLRGTAGLGLYNASKFAVEGLSEALALEMTPFGVRVSVVEPGPYKTDWAGPKSLKRSEAMASRDESSPYFKYNKRFADYFDESDGKQPGDPRQIASVLFDASRHPEPPLHMVFGDFAVKGWKERLEMYNDQKFLSLFPYDRSHI